MTRRYHRREVLRLGAAAAGAAFFVACDGVPGPGDPVEGSTFNDGRLEVRNRGRARRDDGSGLLRLGALGTPDSRRLTADEQLLVYSRLVAVDARNGAVHTDLATAVEAHDPLVVRFALDRDARFHPDEDGRAPAVTADDVRRDFERRAAENVYLFSTVIERIEAPDPRSLVLHLRAPFGLLFEMLATPEASVRAPHRYSVVDDFAGSGPFIPRRRDGDLDSLAASPVYHQPDYPLLDGVSVRRLGSERDLAAGFERGEVDVYRHRLDDAAPSGGERESREDIVQAVRPSRRMTGLGLSMLPTKGDRSVRHVPAFQDDRVRRAVSLALDRDELLELSDAIRSGPVGPAHPVDALTDDELAAHPLYQHDPGEARRLLQAAEVEGLAFGLQAPDRRSVRLMAQVINARLTEAGFAPQLQMQSDADWEDAVLRGDFEAVLFEFTGLNTPDIGLRLHTSGGLSGKFSPWGYSNPVYDAAVRKALSELAPVDRGRRSREAQRLLLDDVPAMFPIGASRERASLVPDIEGYEFDAYDFNAGWLAAGWGRRA